MWKIERMKLVYLISLAEIQILINYDARWPYQCNVHSKLHSNTNRGYKNDDRNGAQFDTN